MHKQNKSILKTNETGALYENSATERKTEFSAKNQTRREFIQSASSMVGLGAGSMLGLSAMGSGEYSVGSGLRQTRKRRSQNRFHSAHRLRLGGDRCRDGFR